MSKNNPRAAIVATFFSIGLMLQTVVGTPAAVAANPKDDSQPIVVSKRVYKQTPEAKLAVNIYVTVDSEENTPKPAIVFFFGGGWRSGSMEQFDQQCRYLARRGMIAITADYRVLSRHKTLANRCVEDAKSAIRWVRQHSAELNIDPDRICAAGGSAGGHLACCTALVEGFESADEDLTVSSVPNAVALFNPAVMIAPLDGFTSAMGASKLKLMKNRTGVEPVRLSPIHHVRPGLPPTVIFHGLADTTVPFDTVQEFSNRMMAAGNRCELRGFQEAPHGFFNFPKAKANPIRKDRSQQWYLRTVFQLDQFLQSLGWLTGPPDVRVVDHDFVSLRGNLQNSLHQFESKKTGHVAFLGGSITEMNGYRPMICDWLAKRFPDTRFTFTNAGISSTCSHAGAFRLQRDILSHGPVDLLFVEFAVNDDQDAGHDARNCLRGMEGIIRHVRRENPRADIVMTHFVNEGMLKTLAAGKPILSASQHEHVASHYQVSSSYLSKEVAARIRSGQLTWKQYGGTHPKQTGNRLAADQAVAILKTAWDRSDSNVPGEPHIMPAILDGASFAHGHLVSPETAANDKGWKFAEPQWDQLPGGKRNRFLNRPVLSAQNPGDQTEFKFSGTAVGAFLLAGPDAGELEVRVDGGAWKPVSLYHRHSRNLHYPRFVMFANKLQPGSHVLEMRVSPNQPKGSSGHAVRILSMGVNDDSAER